MLSKTFQLIKTEIDAENYSLAQQLITELDRNTLSGASKKLYEALAIQIPADVRD